MHEDAALNTDLLKDELGLRRLPHQRLGGHRQAARRHVRRQGGALGRTPASTWRWRRTTSARSSPRSPARSAPGDVVAGAGRRRGPPDPDAEVRARAVRRPVRGPLAGGGRRVPTSTARSPARRSRESQVLLKNADDLLPLARGHRASTSPAPTPTTWATRRAAGRSRGRAARATPRRARRSSRASAGAPGAAVTFSEDASAPVGDAQVGVVVVGETPYAEGVGDVGNNGKSLSLSAADRAAIDTVCARSTCVVLVVAGRPQLVTDQLDADRRARRVAGCRAPRARASRTSCSATQPFTGRLPGQLAGDRRAGAGQRRRRHLRAAVPVRLGAAHRRAARPADGRSSRPCPTGTREDAVQAVLDAPVWDGDALDPARTTQAVRLLATAAAELDGTDRDTAAAAGVVVSLRPRPRAGRLGCRRRRRPPPTPSTR